MPSRSRERGRRGGAQQAARVELVHEAAREPAKESKGAVKSEGLLEIIDLSDDDIAAAVRPASAAAPDLRPAAAAKADGKQRQGPKLEGGGGTKREGGAKSEVKSEVKMELPHKDKRQKKEKKSKVKREHEAEDEKDNRAKESRRRSRSRSKGKRRSRSRSSSGSSSSSSSSMSDLYRQFRPYTKVQLINLVRKADLNGMTGTVVHPSCAVSPCPPGCILVRLETGREIAVKPTNLAPFQAFHRGPQQAAQTQEARLKQVLNHIKLNVDNVMDRTMAMRDDNSSFSIMDTDGTVQGGIGHML